MIFVAVPPALNQFPAMKKTILNSLAAAVIVMGTANSFALIASDNASNYGGSWLSGSNGGTGFGAWAITATPGSGSAGNFIGDPASGGIGGMAADSFGLYANPQGSGASVEADRAFSSALANGDVFSFQWSINFDSADTGNKGFNLYTGSPGVGEIVNVNNAGTAAITFNGTDIGFGYGTNAMTWTFTQVSATQLSLSVNGRDGVGSFTTNISGLAGPVNSFRFYANGMQPGDDAQPYFNNFSVVPEPSTYALLALSAVGLSAYVRRRRARA